MLTLIYITVFLDIDPVKSFPQRQATRTVAEQLGKLIEQGVSRGGGGDEIRSFGLNMVKETTKSGELSTAEVAWGVVLPTAVAFVPAQGTVVRYILNYLPPPRFLPLLTLTLFPAVCTSSRLLPHRGQTIPCPDPKTSPANILSGNRRPIIGLRHGGHPVVRLGRVSRGGHVGCDSRG